MNKYLFSNGSELFCLLAFCLCVSRCLLTLKRMNKNDIITSKSLSNLPISTNKSTNTTCSPTTVYPCRFSKTSFGPAFNFLQRLCLHYVFLNLMLYFDHFCCASFLNNLY